MAKAGKHHLMLDWMKRIHEANAAAAAAEPRHGVPLAHALSGWTCSRRSWERQNLTEPSGMTESEEPAGGMTTLPPHRAFSCSMT